MVAKNDLFLLIKAMTKNEKGYFKKTSKAHVIAGENKYIKLFDAIDRQKEYNEPALKKEFRNEKFIRQLHVMKIYLRNLILKSLRNYYSDSSVFTGMNELISNSELLLTKKLYAPAKKDLQKAKKMADHHELYFKSIEINLLMNRILESEAHNNLNFTSEKLLEENSVYAQKIENINVLSALNTRIHKLNQKLSFSKDAGLIAELKENINHPLLKKGNENSALSITAKWDYLSAFSIYYRAVEDPKRFYYYSKKLVELHDSSPQLIFKKPHTVNLLYNLVVAQVFLKKKDECKATLARIKAMSESGLLSLEGESIVKMFVFIADIELNLCIQWGEFHSSDEVLLYVENNLARYDSELNYLDKAIMCFNMAYVLFARENYHKSLWWLNKILNAEEHELTKEVYCFARILNLIVHYELGNTDLLEYIVKSTGRYLSKRERMYRFETFMLDFFKRKLLNVSSQKETESVFREFQKGLMKIFKDATEKNALNYFDFISWAESKIKRRSFSEIVKEKTRSSSE